MDQNLKPFEKEPLSSFFTISESPSKEKQVKIKSGINQKKPLSSKSENNPANKISIEKAIYATHIQEVNFEEFLKSKSKKP